MRSTSGARETRKVRGGIGAHMSNMISGAHNASINPKGTQAKLSLADAKTRYAAKKHKLALKKARARK